MRALPALLLVVATAPALAQTHGQVRVESFESAALGVPKHLLVYLPPSYERARNRRYPVAYYLHGLIGNEGDWVTLGEIDRVADSLIAAGMPELILVMPDGDDGWYTNWVSGRDRAACMTDTLLPRAATTYCVAAERYEDYVAHDVVAYVDASFRTLADRAHRGIAGLSMGGYGAVVLALKHPNVFSAAASHSGVLSPLFAGPHPFAPPARYLTSADSLAARWRGLWRDLSLAFGTDTATWLARDPARLAKRALLSSVAPNPALYLDVGTEDGLADQNRAFHWELQQIGIAHAYAEYPGAHTWKYWRDHVPQSLRFLADRITR